jgi:hypothetical protein
VLEGPPPTYVEGTGIVAVGLPFINTPSTGKE